MDTQPLEFSARFSEAWLNWLKTVSVTALTALAVCYVVAALRHGLLGGGDRMWATFTGAVRDVAFASPRRIAAIAWLAIKESVRRQASAGIVIFVLVLAFALWFLDADTIDPSALYVGFIMNAVNYLILLMAVVTSAFSLPNDLKQKTIYTIVTKPVRPSEIVLGRILGFTAVCTVPLIAMGACSYAFVVRALDHRHELTDADLRPVVADGGTTSATGAKQGTTSAAQNHRHRVVLDAEGRGMTETNDAARLALDTSDDFLERFGQSHRHRVTAESRDGRTVYTVGPPEGQFHARVPLFGTLQFRDREGHAVKEGYNVGNWTKRGYIFGGTLSAAIFKFRGVREAQFPEGLRLEMDIRLFRTTKEGLDKPILGSLVLRNPITGLASSPRNFAAREYFTLEQFIPRKLTDAGGKPIDVFRDLVVNGEVDLELQCIPRSQLFGVGPEDVYLLPREGRFDVNFAKGFFGIWLQTLLTVTIGVFWSTFLTGPVAMLTTLVTIVGAVLKPALLEIVRGEMYGAAVKSGGMLESMVRLVQQRAVMQELEEGATTRAIRTIDRGLNWFIDGLFQFVPDFAAMSDVQRIGRGFDVSTDALLLHAAQAAGFVVPLYLAAFLIFKSIEVAKS